MMIAWSYIGKRWARCTAFAAFALMLPLVLAACGTTDVSTPTVAATTAAAATKPASTTPPPLLRARQRLPLPQPPVQPQVARLLPPSRPPRVAPRHLSPLQAQRQPPLPQPPPAR